MKLSVSLVYDNEGRTTGTVYKLETGKIFKWVLAFIMLMTLYAVAI